MLVVDHQPLIAATLRKGLEQLFNCEAIVALSSQDAFQLLEKKAVDLLVASYRLPHTDGLTLAREVRWLHPETAIIIISTYGSSRLREQAAELSIRYVLNKPVGLLELREAVLDSLSEAADGAEPGGGRRFSTALAHWLSEQASGTRPDYPTQAVMDLLDQWNRG